MFRLENNTNGVNVKPVEAYRLSGRQETQREQTARCTFYRYAQYTSANACRYQRSPRYPHMPFRSRAYLRVSEKCKKLHTLVVLIITHARHSSRRTDKKQAENRYPQHTMYNYRNCPTWRMLVQEPSPSERVTRHIGICLWQRPLDTRYHTASRSLMACMSSSWKADA